MGGEARCSAKVTLLGGRGGGWTPGLARHSLLWLHHSGLWPELPAENMSSR